MFNHSKIFGTAFAAIAMTAMVGTGFGVWLSSNVESDVVSSSSATKVNQKYAASSHSSSNLTTSFEASIEEGDKLVFDQRDEQGNLTVEGSKLGTLTLEVTMTFADTSFLYDGEVVLPLDVTCDIAGAYDDAVLTDYVNNPIENGEIVEVEVGADDGYETSLEGNKLTVKKNYDFTWGKRRSEITTMEAYNKLQNTVKNGHVNFNVTLEGVYQA